MDAREVCRILKNVRGLTRYLQKNLISQKFQCKMDMPE